MTVFVRFFCLPLSFTVTFALTAIGVPLGVPAGTVNVVAKGFFLSVFDGLPVAEKRTLVTFLSFFRFLKVSLTRKGAPAMTRAPGTDSVTEEPPIEPLVLAGGAVGPGSRPG